jgi:hypothetical protein
LQISLSIYPLEIHYILLVSRVGYNIQLIKFISYFRYNELSGTDFSIINPQLVAACGALACDSNHVDGDDKLCVSYEGSATCGNRWALSGKVRLKGRYIDVPDMVFQSAKLADIFCQPLGSANTMRIINKQILRKKINEVIAEYTAKNILWDLTLWCKFSALTSEDKP